MEYISEADRFNEGAIPHDLPAFTPEKLAIEALVETIALKNIDNEGQIV